jgi:hypothetical protein
MAYAATTNRPWVGNGVPDYPSHTARPLTLEEVARDFAVAYDCGCQEGEERAWAVCGSLEMVQLTATGAIQTCPPSILLAMPWERLHGRQREHGDVGATPQEARECPKGVI